MRHITRTQILILVLCWVVCMELLTILSPSGNYIIAAAGMS